MCLLRCLLPFFQLCMLPCNAVQCKTVYWQAIQQHAIVYLSLSGAAAEESKYTTGRIMQCFMYARAGSAHDNHYAHPLDLLVVLDMNTRAVLEVQAQPLPPTIPALSTNYLAPLVHKERGTRSGAHHPPVLLASLPLMQSSLAAQHSAGLCSSQT